MWVKSIGNQYMLYEDANENRYVGKLIITKVGEEVEAITFVRAQDHRRIDIATLLITLNNS